MLASLSTPTAIQADGRSARAARTRDAVVEALLTLIEEGDLRPTAQRVAEQARVSLRSVFQHFRDLESLFAAAADRQVERLGPAPLDLPPSAPLEKRLDAFVAARSRILEQISPVRRAARLQEPFSEEIAQRLRWSRNAFRTEAERLFAPELALRPESERRGLLAALATASDWNAWEALRQHNELSVQEARRAMRRTMHALLREER